MKKIIFISLFFVLMSVFFVSDTLNLVVQAQTTAGDPTLTGLDATADQVDAFKNQTKNDKEYYLNDFIPENVGNIIDIILSFVGVVFFILIIYAGISWMTSQGNEQQITKAKGLLFNAIIGLVIVFAAYAIVSFLGTNVLNPIATP
jgi:cellobiose-specific phosphotransferase system component IIC